MKKVLTLLFFIGLLFISSFPSFVSACSCAELPSPEEELEVSDAVFSGTVLDVRDRGNTSKSILLQVKHTWKGVDESQVIITTGQGGGDCGLYFQEGTDYLVYASESDMYGRETLVSTICDRTSELDASQADLTVLGEGQPPTKEVDLTGKQEDSNLDIWVLIVVVAGIVAVAFLMIKRKKK